MKKFFALVLAVAMIMSLASVAMAATGSVDLTGPWYYSADDNDMKVDAFEYGDAVYYWLGLNGSRVKDYALIEKLKANVEFEMGEELVESVNIVKKYVDWADTRVEDGYYYFVEFKTAYKEGVVDADVVGTITFDRKEIKAKDYNGSETVRGKIDDVDVDFAFNLFYDNNWLKPTEKYLVDGKNITIKYDGEYALKFDSDEEVELNFASNEGVFTVDVSGQGKVFMKYNTKADEAIVAANPGVKMFFVNFNGAKFNRTGEFQYEMEDGVAAYKVVDGALVEIAGLEVDDGEFTFNTRTLENYVFATAELVNPVAAAPVAPEVTNPTTGA